jgi:hypothetical protein
MHLFNKKGKTKAPALPEGQLGLTTDDLTPKAKIPSMRSKLSKSFEAFTEYTKNLINKSPQRDTTNVSRDPKGKGKGKGKETPYTLLEDVTTVELEDELDKLQVEDTYQPLIMTKKNNFNMFSGKSSQIQTPKFIPAVTSVAKPPMTLSEEEYRQSLLSKILSGPENFSPIFSEKYELKELLGDGAFGFVFAAFQKKTKKEVAVKFILKSKIVSDGWVQDLPLEVHNLKMLNHPNVITYIEHIIEDDFVMLVTELWGTAWDASNLELSPMKNPGLKFKFRNKEYEANGKSGISRTSCDLFECIDARIFYFNQILAFH